MKISAIRVFYEFSESSRNAPVKKLSSNTKSDLAGLSSEILSPDDVILLRKKYPGQGRTDKCLDEIRQSFLKQKGVEKLSKDFIELYIRQTPEVQAAIKRNKYWKEDVEQGGNYPDLAESQAKKIIEIHSLLPKNADLVKRVFSGDFRYKIERSSYKEWHLGFARDMKNEKKVYGWETREQKEKLGQGTDLLLGEVLHFIEGKKPGGIITAKEGENGVVIKIPSLEYILKGGYPNIDMNIVIKILKGKIKI